MRSKEAAACHTAYAPVCSVPLPLVLGVGDVDSDVTVPGVGMSRLDSWADRGPPDTEHSETFYIGACFIKT